MKKYFNLSPSSTVLFSLKNYGSEVALEIHFAIPQHHRLTELERKIVPNTLNIQRTISLPVWEAWEMVEKLPSLLPAKPEKGLPIFEGGWLPAYNSSLTLIGDDTTTVTMPVS